MAHRQAPRDKYLQYSAKKEYKIVEVHEGKQKILTFACDLSRVVVTIYSFSSVLSPVPSINLSPLKNLNFLDTARLDEVFDHTNTELGSSLLLTN